MMVMNLTGIGSQYLMVTVDANKDYFDGGKTYKVMPPKGMPQERFWSSTVYDNQTRSFLDTPQRYRGPATRAIRRLPPKRTTTDRRRFTLPDTACRRQTWELDPDDAREGLVHDPVPL